MNTSSDLLAPLKDQDTHAGVKRGFRRMQTYKSYHPHQCPPDFSLARRHGEAKRVYKYRQGQEEVSGKESCPCCGLPFDGEEIPLDCELDQLYHLGSGYSLYFNFIKYSIALLALVFLNSGITNMITNALGDDCLPADQVDPHSPLGCVENYITKYTIANKTSKKPDLELQLILNFVTNCIILVFFHYVRYQLRKTAIAVDDATVTPADFTIRLSEVPLDAKDDEIVEWIENFQDADNHVVVSKVTRSYNFGEFVNLVKQKTALQNKKSHAKEETKHGIEEQIKKIEEKIAEVKSHKLRYARIVYVTLQRAQHVDFVLKATDPGLCGSLFPKKSFQLKGKTIKVIRASEPSDVKWENLGFERKEKFHRKIVSGLISTLLVIISFMMIIFVSWLQHQSDSSPFVAQIFSFGASILIMVINFLLGTFLRKLADFEKHDTTTGHLTGIADKLSVAQFMNTAISTLVAKYVIANNLNFLDFTTGLDNVNFYGTGGIVESMFFVFISNAFTTPIMNILDPFYYLKLFQRKRIESNPPEGFNQRMAHQLYEGTQVDMSYKFALLIKTMLLTCFYAAAMPIAVVFTIIGLIFVYWTDKYVLLRRAAFPQSIGVDLATAMVESLEWTAFMYAAGNILFLYTLEDSDGGLIANSHIVKFVMWAALIVTFINNFIPMEVLNQWLFHIEDEVTENETYEEARLAFTTDYEVENPVTRKQNLEKFREEKLEGSPSKKTSARSSFRDEEGEPGLNRAQSLYKFLEGYVHEISDTPVESDGQSSSVDNDYTPAPRKTSNFKKNQLPNQQADKVPLLKKEHNDTL